MPSIWGETLGEHRALVLDRLVDAFAQLVRERGFEATTMAAVAERAGLARSAVYNHVRDKHDLLLTHTARVLERTAADLQAALDAEEGVERKLARFVHVTFHSWAAEPGAGHDVMASLDEDERERLLRQLAPMGQMLADVLRDGVQSGELAGGQPEELARFVFATLEGYRLAIASGELDPDRTAQQVTRLVLHGVIGTPG
ncbi:TetR/AcrR family transcriptional regulator [Egicoccus sp. AB-alg2]|uniref:TetR/AcrR family transcriptional regulator n=1 Tax=Egicoccus sp. AB-alg2 TaxID=3242693 RepID=UPI00359DD894